MSGSGLHAKVESNAKIMPEPAKTVQEILKYDGGLCTCIRPRAGRSDLIRLDPAIPRAQRSAWKTGGCRVKPGDHD